MTKLRHLLLIALFPGTCLSAKAQEVRPVSLLLASQADVDTTGLVFERFSPDGSKALVLLAHKAPQQQTGPSADPGNKAGFIVEADLSQLDQQEKYTVQAFGGSRYLEQWYWQLARKSSVQAKSPEEARRLFMEAYIRPDTSFWQSDWFPVISGK